MKNVILIIPLILLFAFTTGDNRSVYSIPLSASAVCATDIDLDGDNDIIINHGINPQTQWGGVYILSNDGKGNFTFKDSIFAVAGSVNIYAEHVFSDNYPDIITANSQHVTIISFDGLEYTQQSFEMGDRISEFALGDIDNDNDLDIVFASNNNFFWGIMRNIDGDSFSDPEYHYIEYPPLGIACKDIDNNGYVDIVISGSNTRVYLFDNNNIDSLDLGSNTKEIDITDIDCDGDLDIVGFSEVISITFIRLFENISNTAFKLDTVNSFIVHEGISEMSIGDFNSDSLMDIILMPFTDFTKYLLYLNQGEFSFIPSNNIGTPVYTGEFYKYFNCADFDGNGFLDIVASHCMISPEHSGIADILYNDGNANFFEDPLESVTEYPNENLTCFNNYPNPFTSSTNFEFTLKKMSNIEIFIFNLNGELIKSISEKNMKGGKHTIKWDGLNNAYQACRPGPYIAYLKVNGTFMQSIKLIIN